MYLGVDEDTALGARKGRAREVDNGPVRDPFEGVGRRHSARSRAAGKDRRRTRKSGAGSTPLPHH